MGNKCVRRLIGLRLIDNNYIVFHRISQQRLNILTYLAKSLTKRITTNILIHYYEFITELILLYNELLSDKIKK